MKASKPDLRAAPYSLPLFQRKGERAMIRVVIIEDDLRIAQINRRFVEKIEGFEVVGIATDQQLAHEHLEYFRAGSRSA